MFGDTLGAVCDRMRLESVQDRRVHTSGPWSRLVIAHLDALLTALYVQLTDQIIPLLGFTRCGPANHQR